MLLLPHRPMCTCISSWLTLYFLLLCTFSIGWDWRTPYQVHLPAGDRPSYDQPRSLCIRRRPAMPGGAGAGQDPGGDVVGGTQDAPGPVLRPPCVPGVHGAGGELAGVQGSLHHTGGHRGEHALTLPIPKAWKVYCFPNILTCIILDWLAFVRLNWASIFTAARAKRRYCFHPRLSLCLFVC